LLIKFTKKCQKISYKISRKWQKLAYKIYKQYQKIAYKIYKKYPEFCPKKYPESSKYFLTEGRKCAYKFQKCFENCKKLLEN